MNRTGSRAVGESCHFRTDLYEQSKHLSAIAESPCDWHRSLVAALTFFDAMSGPSKLLTSTAESSNPGYLNP